MLTRHSREIVPRCALALAALMGFVPRPAIGQTVVAPDASVALGLTVYASFAQVRDTREVTGGAQEILWTGFPETIDPGTIVLVEDGEPIPAEAITVEQRRPGRDALLSSHVGDEVILVAEDGREVPAVLVSAEGPVFRAGDRLVVDWRGHFVIPGMAEAAVDERVIRLRLPDSPSGALTLNYLADGLAWSADYTAVLEEVGPMDLTGGITIRNGSDFGFPDARVQLVAGDVHRGGIPGPEPRFAMAEARVADGAPLPARQPLGDVHLYTLPEPVTLGAYAVAQLPLFHETGVAVEREYVLRGQHFWYQAGHPGLPARENPEVWLHFRNDGLAGRGEPLPAGTLHVYRRDGAGTLQFAGDAAIPGTPEGERIDVAIGTSFDLVAERVQTDFRRLDERTSESAWRITLRNRSRQDRTVQVYEPLAGDATILEESHPHEPVDADTVRWPVSVPGGGEATLTYRARTTF